MQRFVAYAPRYRDNSGGAIVMHKLCDVLNRSGHIAKVWPLWKPASLSTAVAFPGRSLAYVASRLYRGSYATSTRYLTPMARHADIDESVVIYPEIVSGNPLGASRYVRWLLHRPGFHEGRYRYHASDLYFCYQEAFNVVRGHMTYGGLLTIADTMLDIYRIENTAPRTHVAYMVRKGKGRSDLPNLRGQWVLDGLDHASLARAFNMCRICYFYDTHTVYAQYAAACGCIPVIVPEPGVPKEEWICEETSRLGLAYGEKDVPHAIATRAALLAQLRLTDSKNLSQAQRFAEVVRQHFGD